MRRIDANAMHAYDAFMSTQRLAPSERLRQLLLEAAIPIVAEKGWTPAALRAAAEAAELSEGEVKLACPNGVDDLIDAFTAAADEAMCEALAEMDLPNMRVRDKVRAAVLARLEAQVLVKPAARMLSRALALPHRAPMAARMLWRTADLVWRALGDRSTDGNYYSKRTILSGVLASTYARWYADDAPDFEATKAFLDARIENIMQFERAKAKLKPAGAVMEDVIGFAARMRYGR